MKKTLTEEENKLLTEAEFRQTFECFRRLMSKNRCDKLKIQQEKLANLAEYMIFDSYDEISDKEYLVWDKKKLEKTANFKV